MSCTILCDTHGLDPLGGIQRTHVEVYIRRLGETGLVPSFHRHDDARRPLVLPVSHIDGLIPAHPAVYARPPTVHHDETLTQGLDRFELIRFLQVSPGHHGAPRRTRLPPGINALRASEAAAVRIEDSSSATGQSQPIRRATAAASCRLAAPSLVAALER